MDRTNAVEHVIHAARFTQCAAMFIEDRAHFGCGAVPVVGHGIDQQGNAARPETLIAEFIVIDVVGAALGLLKYPVDVFLGHAL